MCSALVQSWRGSPPGDAVERERACDDLVLASGVRPSAYAGHLLDVVTGLAPARWTQSYGLAMARSSSLEGRLVAVLSEKLNRRGVSVALTAIALAIAVGIAVPLAMLRAMDEQLARNSNSAATDMKPQNEDARSLFGIWQEHARTDGTIPGGLVGLLAAKVNEFIHNNTGDASGDPYAKKMPLVPRLDASTGRPPRRWLLDDIAAVSTIPLVTTMDAR